MKGKTKNCELRDIGGTVCCPNAVLAYLRAANVLLSLCCLGSFFNTHAVGVVIAKIISRE